MMKMRPETQKPKRQLPPDYGSRSVQMRLLVAVGALMLVLALMFEARKPENWRWMWSRAGSDGGPPAAQDDVDTRLAPPAPSTDPPGTVYAHRQPPADSPDLQRETLEEAPADEAIQRLRVRGWSEVVGRLSLDEREVLDAVLRASRERSELPDDARNAWAELLPRMGAHWEDYLDATGAAVVVSGNADRPRQTEALLNGLRQLEIDWQSELHPALRAPTEPRPWTQQERDLLADLQRVFDQIALGEIRDDTVWRPAERQAWFRLFEQLQAARPAEPAADRVGFLQLFEQSPEYRGRRVTVRGTVRLAYHVQAPRNPLGIRGYYVFWLRPQGGPNSPIVVYALETPPGFPEIKDKDLDRETTTLDEEVEFTGFFFKRWAYRARDGLHTAPLLLARRPAWEGPAGPMAGAERAGLLPVVCTVLAVLAAAVVVCFLAYSSGRYRSAVAGTSLLVANREALARLHDQELAPTAEETLRRLAERDAPPQGNRDASAE